MTMILRLDETMDNNFYSHRLYNLVTAIMREIFCRFRVSMSSSQNACVSCAMSESCHVCKLVLYQA